MVRDFDVPANAKGGLTDSRPSERNLASEGLSQPSDSNLAAEPLPRPPNRAFSPEPLPSGPGVPHEDVAARGSIFVDREIAARKFRLRQLDRKEHPLWDSVSYRGALLEELETLQEAQRSLLYNARPEDLDSDPSEVEDEIEGNESPSPEELIGLMVDREHQEYEAERNPLYDSPGPAPFSPDVASTAWILDEIITRSAQLKKLKNQPDSNQYRALEEEIRGLRAVLDQRRDFYPITLPESPSPTPHPVATKHGDQSSTEGSDTQSEASEESENMWPSAAGGGFLASREQHPALDHPALPNNFDAGQVQYPSIPRTADDVGFTSSTWDGLAPWELAAGANEPGTSFGNGNASPEHGTYVGNGFAAPVPVSLSPSSHNPTTDHVSVHSSSSNSHPPNNRKRLLASPYHERHSKMIRPSPSPAKTRPDTPTSRGSSAIFPFEIPDELRGIISEEEYREQQRAMGQYQTEYDKRQEQERHDEEFARQLQAQFDGSTSGPSTQHVPMPSMNPDAQRYQSYFDTSGSLRRDAALVSRPTAPDNTPPNQYQPNVQSGYQWQHPSAAANLGAPTTNTSNMPTVARSAAANTAIAGRAPVYSLESDDESNSSDLFTFPSLADLNPPRHPSNLDPWASINNNAGHGGNYGQSHIAQRTRPLPSLPSLPGPSGSYDMGGTSVYNDPYAPTNSFLGGMRDVWSVAASWLGGGGIDESQNGPIDVDALPDRPYSFLPSNINSISGPWFNEQHSYYDSYQDPKETTKQLRELMNNIRPDEELGLTDSTGSPEDMADGCGLYEHQKLGLGWMIQMEEGTNKGGILADDMGLGKTIQAIALMISRRSEDKTRKTTLVVAPLALLQQWDSEIKLKVRPEKRLSTYTYHGTRKKITFRELKNYDVVLTTYGTLGAEYTRMKKHEQAVKDNPGVDVPAPELPLIGPTSKFYRVILDEAQNIKNKNTKAFNAAFCLQATSRFCMTGTPMMNHVGELYSLISFLRIKPYNDQRVFTSQIQGPLREQNASVSDIGMRKLQALLKAILLRRTKKSEINGRPILELPERTTVVEHAEMEGDQLEFYKALETQTQLRFNRYLRNGTVGHNYHSVLLLLLRLRQTCCHPHLIRNLVQDVAGTVDKTPEELEQIAREHLAPDVVKRIMEEGQVDCPICMDATENSTIFTPCGHATCSECFVRISDPSQTVDDGPENQGKFKCMSCRGAVDPTKVTDWSSFQKVYLELPEADDAVKAAEEALLKMAGTGEGPGSESDSDSETESESESESESDSDSETESEESDDDRGSLDDFVVDDDAAEEPATARDSESPSPQELLASASSSKTIKTEDDSTQSEGKKKIDDEDIKDGLTPSKAKAKADDEAYQPSKRRGKPKSKATKIMSKKNKPKSKATKVASKKNKPKSKGKGKKREKLNIKLKNPTLSELQKVSKRNHAARRLYFKKLQEEFVSSAKIDKCIEILEAVAAKSDVEKTIVFSQFTTFLDLLEVPLMQRHWSYKRYDGSMSATARNDAVLEFGHRKRCRIMLVSLKAGNAGLNLTAANNVVILDPFWNPYIEQQAIDRVHRIGQRRPVTCHRILIKESVEDRIMDIQERKRGVIEGALDERAGQGIARLNVQDLAHLFGVTT